MSDTVTLNEISFQPGSPFLDGTSVVERSVSNLISTGRISELIKKIPLYNATRRFDCTLGSKIMPFPVARTIPSSGSATLTSYAPAVNSVLPEYSLDDIAAVMGNIIDVASGISGNPLGKADRLVKYMNGSQKMILESTTGKRPTNGNAELGSTLSAGVNVTDVDNYAEKSDLREDGSFWCNYYQERVPSMIKIERTTGDSDGPTAGSSKIVFETDKFFLQAVSVSLPERNQIVRSNLKDFVLFYGTNKPVINMSFILPNGVGNGPRWAREIEHYMRTRLRGSVIASKNEVVVIEYETVIKKGVILSASFNRNSETPRGVPFNISFFEISHEDKVTTTPSARETSVSGSAVVGGVTTPVSPLYPGVPAVSGETLDSTNAITLYSNENIGVAHSPVLNSVTNTQRTIRISLLDSLESMVADNTLLAGQSSIKSLPGVEKFTLLKKVSGGGYTSAGTVYTTDIEQLSTTRNYDTPKNNALSRVGFAAYSAVRSMGYTGGIPMTPSKSSLEIVPTSVSLGESSHKATRGN